MQNWGIAGDEEITIRLITIISGLLIGLPLGLQENLSALKHISVLGILSILSMVFVFMFTLTTSEVPSERYTAPEAFGTWSGMIRAFAGLCTGFSAYWLGPPLFNELKDASLSYFTKLTGIAYAFCFAVYMSLGFMGYVHFGIPKAGISANVLTWDWSHVGMKWHLDLIRLAVSFSIIASWPTLLMSAHKCFSSISNHFFGKVETEKTKTATTIWRVCLALLSVVIACFRPTLDGIIVANAVLTKFPVVFIVPTCLAIGLDGGWKNWRRHIPGIFMMGFGLLGMAVIGLTFVYKF